VSQVDVSELKGINDPSLVWDTIPFPFTTAQIRHDFLMENNSYVRAYRVINRDPIASLTYRQDSANKQAIVLELASSDEQEGWTSYLEVNPNAVSGLGTLEVDLVTRGNAQKKLKAGQSGR